MWVLQAHSLQNNARKEFDLSSQRQWTIGRSTAADIIIDWDQYLSREHARLSWDETSLFIERLGTAKNRLLFRAEPVDQCTLSSGDVVLIGSTLFRFINETLDEHQALFYEEISISASDLQQSRGLKAEQQLQILASLPMLLEQPATVTAMLELLLKLVAQGLNEAGGVLLLDQESIPGLDSLKPAERHPRRQVTANSRATILEHHCSHSMPAPRVSQRLWRRALRNEQGGVLHIWDQQTGPENMQPQNSAEASGDARYDWAFCLPFSLSGEQIHGLYLYGCWQPGNAPQRERIDSDIRFVTLLVEIASAVIRARQVDKQRVLLEQFLPREVARLMLQEPGSSLLEPRECHLTVLYADVVGFTARAEQAGGQLLNFLDQISAELGCASQAILNYGGIIGDFHGDAVMGFWGWPFENENGPQLALRAAWEVQENLKKLQLREAQIPHGRMRIGIASGKGLAGKIGTADQVKVTVFGSVVNRSQRLQELGKMMKTDILFDEAIRRQVNLENLPAGAEIQELPRMQVPGIPGPLISFCLQPQKTAAAE